MSSIGFFTCVSYQDCKPNATNGFKKNRINEFIDDVENYFNWSGVKAFVIPGKMLQNSEMVELRDLPKDKLTFLDCVKKVIKIVSYIAFGIPALIIKCIIRACHKYTPGAQLKNLEATGTSPVALSEAVSLELSKMRDTAHKANNVSLFVIDKLPKLFNGGDYGQIYCAKQDSVVIKVQTAFFNCQDHDLTYYLEGSDEARAIQEGHEKDLKEDDIEIVPPCNLVKTEASFFNSRDIGFMLDELPKRSPLFPRFEGMVYIKDLKMWGVVFEKIKGVTLYEWLKGPNADPDKFIKMIPSWLEAVRTIHQLSYPIGDFHTGNFMVRDDGTPVVIDHDASEKVGLDRDFHFPVMRNFVLKVFSENFQRSLPSKDFWAKMDQIEALCPRSK